MKALVLCAGFAFALSWGVGAIALTFAHALVRALVLRY